MDRLNGVNLKLFNTQHDSGEYHILLVLSYFKTDDDRWSTFAQSGAFQFPTYITEAKRTATKADLSAETFLLLRHKREGPSRGLHSRRLHACMFGFMNKQHEALELVALVDHYANGGTIENIPEWIMPYCSAIKKRIMAELAIACPM